MILNRISQQKFDISVDTVDMGGASTVASIRKNASGTYWARVCLGRDERTGKQIWLTRTFPPVEGLTPAKAEKEIRQRVYEWEAQARADHEAGLDQHRDKRRLADFIRGSWWTYTTGRGLAYNTIISLKKLSATVTEHFGDRIRLVEVNRGNYSVTGRKNDKSEIYRKFAKSSYGLHKFMIR